MDRNKKASERESQHEREKRRTNRHTLAAIHILEGRQRSRRMGDSDDGDDDDEND